MVKVRELIKVRAAVIKVYDECKAFFEFCIRKKKILVHENVLSFAIRNDVFFRNKKLRNALFLSVSALSS